jgi:hypothetical protein
MAGLRKKKRFSVNQLVVFRFNDRKLVGKVIDAKPVGKTFIYEVLSEDGKVYSELHTDTVMNQCIDTYLTRLFYKKYDIDENAIPEVIVATTDVDSEELVQSEEEPEETDSTEDEGILFDSDDMDPNW